MSDGTLPPLPPDVQALLSVEQVLPRVDPELRVRLRARLSLGGGGGGGAKGGHGHHEPSASSAAGATAPVRGASRLTRGLLRVAYSLSVFTAGGLTGALIHARMHPPSSLPAAVVHEARAVRPDAAVRGALPALDAPATPDAPRTPDAPATPDAPSASVAPLAPVGPAAPPSPANAAHVARASNPSDDQLRAEDAMLSIARTALARGQYAFALEALEHHASRYPGGRLAEEREVLAIQALVGAGRHDEARARAERFRRQHPHSLFAPVAAEVVDTVDAAP